VHRIVWRGLFLLMLGIGGAWILRTFLYEPAIVESGSMEPTLQVGVHYVVNRWVYRLREPKRGDIISFVSPMDGQTLYIKRIIALPGDTIELKSKHVVLNGEKQDESFTTYTRAAEALDGDNLGPFKVPDHMYFVLGDNRDVSYDSSAWVDPKTQARIYFLPFENIHGEVVKL
jgi:signal peptidase I